MVTEMAWERVSPDEWQAMHAGLIAPFPPEEVGERPARGGSGTYSYIDARAVFDRLDAVVGPGTWSTSVRIIDTTACAVECTLTIHGVSRSDVGYPNTAVGATNRDGKRIDSDEPYKDAYSDAVKRAAVQWGIGRYLYPKPGLKGRPAASGQKQNSNFIDMRGTGAGQMPTNPASKAQKDTLQAVMGELAQIRGDDGWGTAMRAGIRELGLSAKSGAELTETEALALIAWGASQRDLLRSNRARPEKALTEVEI